MNSEPTTAEPTTAEPTAAEPAAEPTIAVIGLGYVGLPLAVVLARHYDVIGFDIDTSRIQELERGHDRTGEVEAAQLTECGLRCSAAASDIAQRDIYIVTVPTPVSKDRKPDLSALTSASELVGAALKPGAIVVYESTVYPGVTEDHCAPVLETASGLVCGRDFFLGYSPERINPGDREHTVDRITKIVAGQTDEVTRKLADIYGRITTGGIYIAPNIKTAEAAKAIENAQRDINIAFVNEISVIVSRLGLNALDVLEAAETKWNFLPFRPGLVGGHCIGVDPYYLAHAAEIAGHHPEMILAGRKINDAMGSHIADRVWEIIGKPAGRILILGITFKENVPDLRNSKVIDIIDALSAKGAAIDVHDPMANRESARNILGFELIDEIGSTGEYDAVIGAVQHDSYKAMSAEDISRLVTSEGLVADIKGMWRQIRLPAGLSYWQL
jgi:UDP-N-acetyl-D-galactosamine dehydrogenase